MTGARAGANGIKAVTPYLAVRNARAAMAFYAAAFGARQMLLIEEQDGRIGHATLGIGPDEIYLATSIPSSKASSGRRPSAAPPSRSISRSRMWMRPSSERLPPVPR